MNAFKLVFSAKICFKVVVGGVKIRETIVFLVNLYYQVLPYLMMHGNIHFVYIRNTTVVMTYSTLQKNFCKLVVSVSKHVVTIWVNICICFML